MPLGGAGLGMARSFPFMGNNILPAGAMAPKYRSDIDGLRAIAVGGVVIYHAFPTLLPGGFVGVDVFFVISGFLITSIIASDALAGKFSIAGFYERRFRRILPALLFMLILSTVAALLILPPTELEQYGQSLIAVALFGSNILFWREGGYFDQPAHDKPLLHTWSLAVEEQFYILWPLIIALLVALGRERTLRAFVWAAVIGSLLAAEAVVRWAPTQAFYLIPYRAWELGFGALLAVGAVPALQSVRQRETVAWVGLALIFIPMLFYSPETPFPGLSAVPPCLGTMMLIHAGREGLTQVGRMLSWRPILFTGLISYGFYLWHWPALVFTQIALNRPLHPLETVLAISAAFALASFSLRFVERPFRQSGQVRISRRTVLTASGVTMGLFASAGAAAYATNGFADLASPRVKVAQAAMESINPFRGRCHNNLGTADLGPIDQCSGGAESRKGYNVLLWGDSHGDHLMPGLDHQGAKQGFAVRQATVSGCSPLILTYDKIPALDRPCADFHRAALAEAAHQPDLGAIVLSVRWSTAIQELSDKSSKDLEQQKATGGASLSAALDKLIAAIRQSVPAGTRIILVGSTPEFGIWPATCFARAYKLDGDPNLCATQIARDASWGTAADKTLTQAAAKNGLALILPRASFCQGALCRTIAHGKILFRDDDHLTNEGSEFATEAMGPLLSGLALH